MTEVQVFANKKPSTDTKTELQLKANTWCVEDVINILEKVLTILLALYHLLDPHFEVPIHRDLKHMRIITIGYKKNFMLCYTGKVFWMHLCINC